jgi:large subunit ribosomal protein L6e
MAPGSPKAGAKKTGGPKNPLIARGIRQFGPAAMYGKRKQAKYAKKGGAKKAPAPKFNPEAIVGKYVPAEIAPRPLAGAKKTKPTKLRKSITPGTVLIILAGRFAGSRCVFLKQLASGLLLVSGPFKLSGVPVRRVNQSFVIATSTKVDVSKVPFNDINDAYFAKKAEKSVKGEDGFWATAKAIPADFLAARKATQTKVDAALTASVNAVPQLAAYLKSKFTLAGAGAPHLIKF